MSCFSAKENENGKYDDFEVLERKIVSTVRLVSYTDTSLEECKVYLRELLELKEMLTKMLYYVFMRCYRGRTLESLLLDENIKYEELKFIMDVIIDVQEHEKHPSDLAVLFAKENYEFKAFAKFPKSTAKNVYELLDESILSARNVISVLTMGD